MTLVALKDKKCRRDRVSDEEKELFKTFTKWVGNLLAVLTIGLLLYHRLETVAAAVTLILALGYIGGAWLSRKSANLYPGAIFFSLGYILTIGMLVAPGTLLLFGLPLAFLLFGLGYFLKHRLGDDFRKPLDTAGHLSVFLLIGILFYQGALISNYALVIISLAIYSGLYLGLFLLARERWYLLPGAIVFSFVYYFLLKGIPLISPTALPAYFVAIGLAYAVLGFFLAGRGKAQQSTPLYTAAVILLLGTTGLALVGGGFQGGGSIFVFLVSALAYGLLFLFTRRDEFIYLITLSLGLLVYNLVKVSGDKFSLKLIDFFLYALIALGLLLLYPLLKRLLRSAKPFSLFIIRNWKGMLIFSLPLAALILLFVLFSGVETTENPYFCAACHNTEPQFKRQYQNWQSSAHKEVACIKCHYPPGLQGLVAGKIDGIRHLALYITKSIPTVQHARIEDRSCLQCHSREQLYRPMVFAGKIKFNHEVHLSGEVRGMKLPCTTCHAHTVEDGTHFEVEKSACFTCHLQNPGEKGTAIGSCLTCHNLPGKTIVLENGSEFVHTEFFAGKKEKDIDCMRCHSEVTRGKGEASLQRCISCHDVKFKVNNVDELHRFHLEKKKVDCFECHTPIKHGIIRKTAGLAPECATCHGSGHSVPERLYAGKGGVGVKDDPSPMYSANVDCQGCHRYESKTVPPAPGGVKIANRQSCISCHGEAFGGILGYWKKDTAEKMNEVKDVFTAIEEKLPLLKGKADEITLKEAGELYKRAKVNYNLVREDGSYGAHNKNYIDSLLEKAKKDAQASLKLLEKENSKLMKPQEKRFTTESTE